MHGSALASTYEPQREKGMRVGLLAYTYVQLGCITVEILCNWLS